MKTHNKQQEKTANVVDTNAKNNLITVFKRDVSAYRFCIMHVFTSGYYSVLQILRVKCKKTRKKTHR